MKETILFNGLDEEQEISVSATELKEFINAEVNSKNDSQDSELEAIKGRLDDLETTTSGQAEEINSANSEIFSNKTEIESNKAEINSIKETIESLTTSLNATNESLSNEISNRQTGIENAKTELSESFEAELSKETDSRKAFENLIQNQIAQEIEDRKEADSELESKIYNEVSNSLSAVDFESADKKVKSDLTAHIETVQTELTTEVKQLESLVNTFRTSLNEEIANRIKADNALQNNSNGSGGQTEYSSNYELITIDSLDKGEVSDDSIFLQSFNTTDSYITALQVRNYVDSPRTAEFQNEVFERKSDVSKLEAKLTTEATNRKDEDSKLQNEIDSLDTRTSTNENVLKILTGTGEGSIKKSIADRIAEVVSNAPEAFDTLKEIADWVNEHETDVLSMQNSISSNASAISIEVEERKNEIAKTNLAIETEKANRINSDSAIQESIVNLSQALEAEAAERENTKAFIHDTLKEEFENQISDLTNATIGEIVDDKHQEIANDIAANAKNIVILEDKISENKAEIDTLNKTVFSEKTNEKILVSNENGIPEWNTLSSLVKSVNVNSSNIDERGNLLLNIPSSAKLVSFANGANSIDGFLVPFKSSNGNWYVHVANWWGGIYGNGIVRGTCYYID